MASELSKSVELGLGKHSRYNLPQMKFAALPRASPDVRATTVLIVFLAFVLRVAGLDAQAIWWDESLSHYRATRDLATILANTILIQNVLTTDLQPPLYFLMLHALVGTLGTSEFSLRFLSLAANVATVALLYTIGKRLFSRAVGMVAALLGALSPLYVWYSQEARPYALVLLWSALAVYALARALQHKSTARSDPSLVWVLVYSLSTIAGLYTNYYAAFLLPFHVVFIFLAKRAARARYLLLPMLPASSAIFLLPIITRGAAGNVHSGPSFVALEVILRDLVHSFSVGITLDPARAVWFDAATLILFLVGIVLSRESSESARVPSSRRLALAFFLFLPTLAVYAASFIRPLYQHARYLIAWSPAWYLGVALGIAYLAQRSRIIAGLALAIPIAGAIISLSNLYVDPHYAKDDHRAWAEHLRARSRVGDFLILTSPHTAELYEYYARGILPFTTLPILRSDRVDSPQQDSANVRAALSNYERVWFLSIHAPFDDPQARIEKLLNENGVLLDTAEFHGTSTAIALSLYARAIPTARASEIARPLDLLFDSRLRLVGFEPPPKLSAGARGVVKLYWKLDEPAGEDYGVSLRAVSDGGARVGQWDAIPLGNRAGSSTWTVNQVIVAAHDLPIARSTPAGKYHLQLQVYHSATGAGIGDAVILGDISVESP